MVEVRRQPSLAHWLEALEQVSARVQTLAEMSLAGAVEIRLQLLDNVECLAQILWQSHGPVVSSS